MQIARSRKSHTANATQPILRLAQPPVEGCQSIVLHVERSRQRLPKLVQMISDALRQRSFEIVIVDDNSKDNTVQACRELAAQRQLPAGRLINRPAPRHGLSGAVICGLEAANGEYLCRHGRRPATPPSKNSRNCSTSCEAIERTVAIGSRYVAGGDTEKNWGIWRKLNSRVATLLAKPVACGTHDPMSGFFALRAGTFQPAQRLNPTGYKIALELLCKCRVKRIAEVPIHFGRRQLGQSKLSARQQWRFLIHLSRLYSILAVQR